MSCSRLCVGLVIFSTVFIIGICALDQNEDLLELLQDELMKDNLLKELKRELSELYDHADKPVVDTGKNEQKKTLQKKEDQVKENQSDLISQLKRTVNKETDTNTGHRVQVQSNIEKTVEKKKLVEEEEKIEQKKALDSDKDSDLADKDSGKNDLRTLLERILNEETNSNYKLEAQSNNEKTEEKKSLINTESEKRELDTQVEQNELRDMLKRILGDEGERNTEEHTKEQTKATKKEKFVERKSMDDKVDEPKFMLKHNPDELDFMVQRLFGDESAKETDVALQHKEQRNEEVSQIKATEKKELEQGEKKQEITQLKQTEKKDQEVKREYNDYDSVKEALMKLVVARLTNLNTDKDNDKRELHEKNLKDDDQAQNVLLKRNEGLVEKDEKQENAAKKETLDIRGVQMDVSKNVDKSSEKRKVDVEKVTEQRKVDSEQPKKKKVPTATLR